MGGSFRLQNEVISFKALSFAVPGAAIDLAGDYAMEQNALDFRGIAKTRRQSLPDDDRWKHWLLKPADPFFAKDGAGTLLRIKVGGTTDNPQFGLDLGKHVGSPPTSVSSR